MIHIYEENIGSKEKKKILMKTKTEMIIKMMRNLKKENNHSQINQNLILHKLKRNRRQLLQAPKKHKPKLLKFIKNLLNLTLLTKEKIS